jgi:hypothetical protein
MAGHGVSKIQQDACTRRRQHPRLSCFLSAGQEVDGRTSLATTPEDATLGDTTLGERFNISKPAAAARIDLGSGQARSNVE